VWITALVVGLVATAATSSAHAQGNGVISGTVTDAESQQPVPRAQVYVVGTTRRALTGDDGRYVLRGVSPGAVTVRTQLIGYKPAERQITLTESAEVNFALERTIIQLTEVTSYGYGTERQADRSSSVTTVTAEQIQNAPVAGVDAAIQGRAPGVQVVQNAGNPGNGITVRVRGAASLSANNQPLWVIDGVPMLSDEFTQMSVAGQDLTAVTGINPDEIESIDVLKDAAAAGIYGSRASNGVVIVKTKRGRAGNTRISFNAYYGLQERTKKLDMLTGTEYVDYMNEAYLNDYPDDYPLFCKIGEITDCYYGDNTYNTDWQEAIFRQAPVSDININAEGGNERLRYFISGSRFDQNGIVIGSGYERNSARVNVDFNATEKLALRSSVYLTREIHTRNVNDNTIVGVVTNAIANEPIAPIRRPDGLFATTDDGMSYANPVAVGSLNTNEVRVLRALGNLEATFNITDNLMLNSRLGLDVLNNRDLVWESPQIVDQYAGSVGGAAEMGNNTANRYLAEGYLTFDKPLSSASNVSLLGGASVEYNSNELDWLRGESFANEQFRYPGNAGRIVTYDGDKEGYNIVSVFSRANATIRDRYLFSASLRTDASSRFGADNRWAVFPAGSVGWVVTKEPFAEGLARHADLKFRASYGITGNQGIGNFAPLARYGKANYSELPGLSRVSFENPKLKWETTKEFDIGADLFLFSGRVGIIADWYNKTTEDLLIQRPITSTSGVTFFWDNVGSIRNRGWELALTTTNFQASDANGFRWTSEFNVSHNKNVVTELYGDQPFLAGFINRVEVGQPLGAFYTLKFEGVDPQTGDAIFQDTNGDGSITADDRVVIGDPHPDYYGGLNNTWSWRGFDLRAFFQFSQGNDVWNAMREFSGDGGYNYDNKFADQLKRWQQPGDITNVPRASWDGASGAADESSAWLEDGSYVRLQEITLGYRLPARVAGVANLSEARIYVTGRNLKTWTDYSGYNPDVNSFGSNTNLSLGTDFYAYPLARSWAIGVSGSW
jgi:TonB-linked SusC/RagA family outer membrane protein